MTVKKGSKKAFLHTAEDWIYDNRIFILGLMLCILLLLLHGMSAGHFVDFFPINGNFQDYNPIRRLIGGQIPFQDFQDYLGLGHLYMGTVFTAFFGGDFQASLVAFCFLAILGFALISYLIGRAVFRKREYAIALTNMVLVLVMVQPLFFSNALTGFESINEALSYVLEGGNSARILRGMILPVSCILVWAGRKFADKRTHKHTELAFAIITGVVAGFSFAWSNDYGISCFVCLALMTFWSSFCKNRKILEALKYTACEIIVSLICMFVFVELFTAGHFQGWLHSIFGTGGYQRWYYNSEKSYYLWDLDLDFPVLLQAGIFIYYCIRMFIKKAQSAEERGQTVKFRILAYMNMAGFCAVQEYKLLSGGESREVAMVVLLLTILYEGVYFVLRRLNGRQKIRVIASAVSFLFGIILLLSMAKDELAAYVLKGTSGVYIEELGGNMNELGEDILETKEFLGDEQVFATYASAQEVVSGTFQPSGTDYIIHVLGDEHREEYLKVFEEGDFRYAATINDTYTDWEYWVQKANWFFYRSLFAGWHPVYTNSYEVYWERNEDGELHELHDGIKLSIEVTNEAVYNLSVDCDPSVNGVADVFISYDVCGKGDKASLLNWQKMLKVENSGRLYSKMGMFIESNYLRESSGEYIPVVIADGHGEVNLVACPVRSTYLNLKEYSCDTIFTVTSDYLEVSEAETDENGCVICVPYTRRAEDALKTAYGISYNGEEGKILDIMNDNEFFWILTDINVDLENGNMVKIVR